MPFMGRKHRLRQVQHIASLHWPARPQASDDQINTFGGVLTDLLAESASVREAHCLRRAFKVDDTNGGPLHEPIVNYSYESHKRNCQLVRLH